MRSRLLVIVLTGLALTTAACRQPDGPVPTPDGEDTGRLVDLSRDVLNSASGDPQGPPDLAIDVAVFVDDNDADGQAAATELARRTAAAVAGVTIAEPAAREVAERLWMATRATQLSERQVEDLQEQFRTTLTSAGVPPDRIEPVVEQVAEVQRTVTTVERRWYQLF